MKNIFLIFLLFVPAFSQTRPDFDIQGHRRSRGLVPENTIPSFLKALEFGVTTLELDVVISKDKRVVVPHEPWFSSVISLDPKGQPIPADRQKSFNLYLMKYAEIKRNDVGGIGNKDFPAQQRMKVAKPLLKDVFRAVNEYIKKNKLKSVRYNIEIKSSPDGDNNYHPAPAVFTKLVYDDIIASRMEKLVDIQSFDVRPLQELRKFPVEIPISLLVSNRDGIERNIARLRFVPEIYSPHYMLVDKTLVDYCRARKIRIIPWTVNEIADLERMKALDLDWIITDYPNRAAQVFRN